MSKIYVVGDMHYGHSGIVKGVSTWEDKSACRNFSTLEEHNDTIIHNINSLVNKEDYLFCTGDLSLGGKENVGKLRERIKCKNVVAILGNHDIALRKNSIIHYKNKLINCQDLFTSVHDMLEKKWFGRKFFLCHYAMYDYPSKSHGTIHLYAHSHKELNYDKQAICTSIDCHPEFRPFSLKELIDIYNDRLERH